jgi:predicted transcriptional regulator
MDVLWTNAERPFTCRDVTNELDGYAYTTIATVLDRLARKGELRRARRGQVLTFTATETSAAHTARAMREALDQSDDPVTAIARLGALLSDEEVASMRAALGSSTRRSSRREPRRTLR